MIKLIYTPKILPAHVTTGVSLPLNPLTVLSEFLHSCMRHYAELIGPEWQRLDAGFFEKLSTVIFLYQDQFEAEEIGYEIAVGPPTLGGPHNQLMNMCLDTSGAGPVATMRAQESNSAAEIVEHEHSFVSTDHEVQANQVKGVLAKLVDNEHSHVDTIMLRRSSRSNKYNGFRVPLPSDKKTVNSKVKPRKNPAVHCTSIATAPSSAMMDGKVSQDIPPPTSIPTIQSIGTNMCGIHPDKLSPKKLLASLKEEGEKGERQE